MTETQVTWPEAFLVVGLSFAFVAILYLVYRP